MPGTSETVAKGLPEDQSNFNTTGISVFYFSSLLIILAIPPYFFPKQ
jgi:hypothetical protein